jgi:hypothetical protein
MNLSIHYFDLRVIIKGMLYNYVCLGYIVKIKFIVAIVAKCHKIFCEQHISL